MSLEGGSSAFQADDGMDPAHKPYLGGFKDKRTGLEYHHAYTQTPIDRRSKWADAPVKFSRDTQTSNPITRSAQTFREGNAQTLRKDLYEDEQKYKTVAVKTYFTSEQLREVWESKCLILQCWWRSFLARKRAREMKEALEEEKRTALALLEKQRQVEEAQRLRDIERRLNPRTREDLALLYDEVEAWRVAETETIKREVTDEKLRTEAFKALLEKETALLATVERLRTRAVKLNAEESSSKKMAELASSKVWGLSDGTVAKVDTPFTVRARELKLLLDGLSILRGLPVEERMDLLLNVKYTVSEFDCAMTREIIALIDREADMLQRRRPEDSLQALRQRLRNLFRAFCETPAFNPEAAKLQQQKLQQVLGDSAGAAAMGSSGGKGSSHTAAPAAAVAAAAARGGAGFSASTGASSVTSGMGEGGRG